MHSDSLERLVPDLVQPNEVTGQLTLQLHLARYQFAAAQAKSGRLLDIACGVGYGTPILYRCHSDNSEAIGVDCCEESINYAREKYGRPGIRFFNADAMKFEDPEGFDTIVSLETIEHMPNPAGFMRHLVRQLRPGGVLVGSVPTTPTVDANPHHFHDFTESSFRRLLDPYGMTEVACFPQVQHFNPITILTRNEARLNDLRPNLGCYYLTHPTALVQRIWSCVRFGFSNRYLTIAWQAPR